MATAGMNPLRSGLPPRVLITGATGGIGRALCRTIGASQPAILIATGRSADKLEALSQDLGRPGYLQTKVVDFSSEDSISALGLTLQTDHGHMDLWLHCIGGLHGTDLTVEKSLRDINPEAMVAAFRSNTLPFVLLAKHLKPLFRPVDKSQAKGSVITVLSAKVGSIGDNHLGGWYSYRMSKAALNMAVRNVALEYNRSGCPTICVAVHPGTTATELSSPFTVGYSEARLYSPDLTAERLLGVVRGLEPKDNGTFLNWDGTQLPW